MGVACLTLKGTPLATLVLIARTREGVFSPLIEIDLCILLAEVEGARSMGGESAEGPAEREFEWD